MIRQYTRACVRQHLRLSGGKCTAVRLLKKNYMGDTEQLQDVEHLKEMAADPRFEAAVQEGVCTFLREHEIPHSGAQRRKEYRGSRRIWTMERRLRPRWWMRIS